jgi:hypothetical protein
MAQIDVSEFQFSFAFFHKFMSLKENKGKSFAVPSLREEGGNGDLAGLDLKVGEDYFFQFKMSDRLKTIGAKEIQSNRLDKKFLPYFRFNIKNSDKSNQFNTLVQLANNFGQNKVFFVSPLFDYPNSTTTDDEAFGDFWCSKPKIAITKTCFIDLFQFTSSNPLLNEKNNKHVICYNLDSIKNDNGYLLSEPNEIVTSNEFSSKSNQEPVNLIEKMFEIAEILDSSERLNEIRDWKISDILEINSKKNLYQILNILQIEIISRFNIFWIPQIIKEG